MTASAIDDTEVDHEAAADAATGAAASAAVGAPAADAGPPGPADMLRALMAALTTVGAEYSGAPTRVTGTIPPEINGVLFRNGPGRFERGGRRYGHPFDGDGHVQRIDLRGGRARYTNRFVRTAAFLEEEAAGRMRRRSLGTNLPGGMVGNLLRFAIKNPANTSVVWHAGRLLALWEGGLPHRLDPITLATLGADDLNGGLRNPFRPPARWLAPLLPFSAHPRIDADTGEMINFGVVPGSPSHLVIHRIDRAGRLAPPQAHPLPRFAFVHDIAVTRRFICALLPRIDFDIPRALLGLRTAAGSLTLDSDEPMQMMLIPRDGGEPRFLDLMPGFVFHIAQGFDRDDGAVVLDLVRYDDYPAFDDLDALFDDTGPTASGSARRPLSRLERLVLDPDGGGFDVTAWSDRAAELPTTRAGAFGARHRFIYSIGAPADRHAPYLTAVQRLDTLTGAMQVRDFGMDLVGEPVHVPAPGAIGNAAGAAERNDADADTSGEAAGGWLLSLVHRAGEARTDLVILREADLGIEASVALPHAVPPGFHGCWVGRGQLGGGGPASD